MSANETMTVSSTGAKKAENDERYDLIPAEALRELAKHYGVGAKKYDDRNWEQGYEWHKSYAALNRHLWQFWNGEDIDAETGSKHIIAVAWHAFVLATFMATHPEFDDRPSTLAAARGVDPEEYRFPALGGISVEDIEQFKRAIRTTPTHIDSLEPEWTRKHTWQVTGSHRMYRYMYDRWWFRGIDGEWAHSCESYSDLNAPGGYDLV